MSANPGASASGPAPEPPPLEGSRETAGLPDWHTSLAGLLAEHAITKLTLRPAQENTRPLTLNARVTDLPGTLLRAGPCTLESTSTPEIRLTIASDRVAWSVSSRELHQSLQSLLGAHPR